MSKRSLIIIILILVTAIALPLTVYLVQQQQELRSRAAPATTLCFATVNTTTCATTISATAEKELTIDVLMTTGTNQVTAAELFVPLSDASLFQTSPAPTIREITGGKLPLPLVKGAFSGGTFTITVGAQPGIPANGSNISIARVTLTPSRNGSTKLSFGATTRIAGIQEGSNVLSSSQDATITVTGGAAPTAPPGPAGPAAPTATPPPAGGPTPTALTPTPTGTITPSPTVKPAVTVTPAVTATPTAKPVVVATPIPTQVVGKGGQPIPEAGNITPTTIILGIGTFLLLIGGALLFL